MTIDTTPKSPLDGLVSCGACGAPMEYEAPTQDHEASYACRSVHTSGGDSRSPLRVEAHTTDRVVIRSVLEAILTERSNFILESTIRNPGEQEDMGPQFPSEDISLLKEDPYFFLQAVKGMENATQLITHVEVTPSSGSDTDVSVPVVDGLAERKVRPDELFADTAYGSGRNAFEASRRGTELVSPVAGSAPGNSHEGEGDGPPPLTAADFQIDVTGEQATVCPAGHPSIEEYELKDAPERVEVHFAGTTCEPCPLRSRCPVKLDRRAGAYVLKADLVKVNIERRRRAEATEEWRKRYDIRAGIEGTNSELKRAHGLGRLRVRGGRRVRLAVYLKALACNFKRMVHARLVEMENTAQRAVGTVPAVAAA